MIPSRLAVKLHAQLQGEWDSRKKPPPFFGHISSSAPVQSSDANFKKHTAQFQVQPVYRQCYLSSLSLHLSMSRSNRSTKVTIKNLTCKFCMMAH